jgi:hypothetical protein
MLRKWLPKFHQHGLGEPVSKELYYEVRIEWLRLPYHNLANGPEGIQILGGREHAGRLYVVWSISHELVFRPGG